MTLNTIGYADVNVWVLDSENHLGLTSLLLVSSYKLFSLNLNSYFSFFIMQIPDLVHRIIVKIQIIQNI